MLRQAQHDVPFVMNIRNLPMLNQDFLTPAQIVAELDKYIIGQHEAKRHVAIALRNRWRRLHAPLDMQAEIVPNNILMIGATGVGKTEIARRLAHLADAPFVKVEASKFTEVGYVGRDVESMVRDLAEQSVGRVKARRQEAVKAQAADFLSRHSAYKVEDTGLTAGRSDGAGKLLTPGHDGTDDFFVARFGLHE